LAAFLQKERKYCYFAVVLTEIYNALMQKWWFERDAIKSRIQSKTHTIVSGIEGDKPANKEYFREKEHYFM